MFSGSLLAMVLLFAGIVILFKAVRMVPQGYEWTVEAFGKYTHTLSPGLHFLVPVYQGRTMHRFRPAELVDVADEVVPRPRAA